MEAVEGALLLGAEIAGTHAFINGTAIRAKLFPFFKSLREGKEREGGLVSHNTGIPKSDKPNIPHERGHIYTTYSSNN